MHKEIHKITKKMKYKLRKKHTLHQWKLIWLNIKKKINKVTTHTLNYL